MARKTVQSKIDQLKELVEQIALKEGDVPPELEYQLRTAANRGKRPETAEDHGEKVFDKISIPCWVEVWTDDLGRVPAIATAKTLLRWHSGKHAGEIRGREITVCLAEMPYHGERLLSVDADDVLRVGKKITPQF